MLSPSSAACRLNGHLLPLTTIVSIHQFEEVIELGYIKINRHFFVFVNKIFLVQPFIKSNVRIVKDVILDKLVEI